MKTKVLSIFLALAMLVGILAVMPLTASAATNITVGSVDEWMEKLSGKDVGEANILVTAKELDFSEKTVMPVKNFKGTFNGQGVVIKNLNMVGDSSTGDEIGLFNCLTGVSTFKNFAIIASTFTGTQWCGAIACCTKGDVTVENVYIGEDVTINAGVKSKNSYAGGLFGGCTKIDDNTPASVTISNCVFAGTVNAEGRYNGGFVGDLYKATGATITNSMVTGKIPADKDSSRGFIGTAVADNDTIVMTNCIYAGGAAGSYYKDLPFFNGISEATVTNCYTVSTKSDGKVYNSKTVEDEDSGVSLIAVTDLVGANAAVTVEGFTKRENDIMLPTALVELFGNNLPSTADKYTARYTVTWQNEDGTVLATEEYDMGAMPEYKGEIPTKAEDDTYTYTFSAWSPAVGAVVDNITYVAEFYKTRKNVVEDENDENGGSNENEALDDFPPANTETDAPATENSGCGSVIGGGAVALVAVIGSALVIGKKRKD